MTPILWALVGAGTLSVTGVAVMAAVEREFREAVGQTLLGLVAIPAVLVAHATRWGWVPRVMPLSNRAVELIARQVSPGRQKAWAFTYLDRGVIVVRRSAGSQPLADRAQDARRTTRRRI